MLVFLYGFSAWRGKLCTFFFGGGAESERSAGISLRIQCLGGENCVLFFLGGERSLSGVLVFLYGFSAWEGKTVSFFFGRGGERSLSGVLVFNSRTQCLERWYFFTDSVFGRGKLCVLFSGGGGALVFLHGFSVWSGGISSRIQGLGVENCGLFSRGGGSVALVFLHGFSVWEGKTVSFFFFLGGGAGISLENETMVILQEGGSTKAT